VIAYSILCHIVKETCQEDESKNLRFGGGSACAQTMIERTSRTPNLKLLVTEIVMSTEVMGYTARTVPTSHLYIKCLYMPC